MNGTWIDITEQVRGEDEALLHRHATGGWVDRTLTFNTATNFAGSLAGDLFQDHRISDLGWLNERSLLHKFS
jgi:hypothetical protein